MNILNIMTCYNEIEYLPYTVEYYQDLGIDVFVLDNFSTDGSYEWLIQNKIPCERVDTNGAFHLVKLQIARLATMHFHKPDWVIYGDADEFIVIPNLPLKQLVGVADEKGFNLIKCRKLNFYNTGEKREKKNPKDLFFYYKEAPGLEREIVRIHKYQSQIEYSFDFVQVTDPKICIVEGFVLNYGGTKSKEQREDVLLRRQKAWKEGLTSVAGEHYIEHKNQDWIWKKNELYDVRNLELLRGFLHAA